MVFLASAAALAESRSSKILQNLRSSVSLNRILSKRDIKTLTVNAGSTTLKYSLYDVSRKAGASTLETKLIASGLVDKVGTNEKGSITHNSSLVVSDTIPSHTAGFNMLLDVLKENENIETNDIECVGHRVVHGGSTFSKPTIITSDVLGEIQELSSLAPLHNPPAASGIEASSSAFPSATQVAVFDTAFHATMPPPSYRYAIPKDLYEDHGIRKYGFHGTSYQYVMEATAEYLGKKSSDLNLIVMHLGGGASMCCIQNGKSIDTTMGLTPLEGLVMATRSGDLDPGIYDYMLKNGFTEDEVYTTLNKESGLLGLAGRSSDMRIIKDSAQKGDSDCRLARQVFSERCRKYLGSYFVKLGGKVDAIVFTGGIGEGDADMRKSILEGLQENLQIGLDHAKNENAVGADITMTISPAFSKTKVLVVPTDEEISIATQSANLVLPEEKIEAVDSLPRLSQVKTNLVCHSIGHSYTAPEEIGLMSVFASSVDKIGYFRPFGKLQGHDDYRIRLMKDHFQLKDDESAMFGMSEEEGLQMIADGQEDELVERIIKKYLEYSSTKDFVMVSTYTENDDALHWAGKIASTLNLPAVIIGDKSHSQNLGIAQTAFQSHGSECLGVIVTDVENVEEERKDLLDHDLKPLALIPKSQVLSRRTVREVLEILDDGVCLYGEEHLDVPIRKMLINTMQVNDIMDHLEEDQLIIVSHKRVDVLMSLLLAAQSSNAPNIAGILFTYHEVGDMNKEVASLLNGLSDIRIPVIATSSETFKVASKIDQTPTFITSLSKGKIDAAVSSMIENLDYSLLDHFQSDEYLKNKRDIGPRLFQYSAFQKARQLQKTIVLPEGADPRVVEAASILVKRKLCDVILVGDPDIIRDNAEKLRVSLEGVTICDPQNYELFDEMVDSLVEARKSKGLTPLEATKFLSEDVNYFGTMMMHMGLADGMVSGAMHSSANTIRPALQILKTAPGASVVSSIFFMLLEDGVKVFGDCAINVAPNAQQLSEIAVASAKTSLQFGIEPRVALLSYATGDSNSGDMIDAVIEATALAKEKAEKEGFLNPDLIEGPLQFDAAVDPAVAAIKAKDSLVAGRANCLIFPDLNAGNNGYKAVQQASKTIAVGPVLQGLKMPVNDLSRGATVDDIVNTAVVTALQAADSDSNVAEQY
eukprot:CAMPEP_0116138024 /NCGR_PEP_ID=MMETSP0329-20121206/12553_1 /TAXON_ID=697910 /ORGANISM="Pseudo-nitzschia arenysensis, Strain B593" /LENGTH=1155 /DNA_ID=CAMNT_0003632963 /DNA_START=128 /DNA_END=3595 /DNA_ORIENTATION=+